MKDLDEFKMKPREKSQKSLRGSVSRFHLLY